MADPKLEKQNEERKKKLEQAQNELQAFQAVFLLAYMRPATFRTIPNGYCSKECCTHLPWYEVETMRGTIIIGWRKSVIMIDWSKTGNVIDPKKWGDDTVYPTRDQTFIHAHGYAKAVEYLGVLSMIWPHVDFREDWLKREAEAGRVHALPKV